MTDHAVTLDRARYAALYGPTVGDRIRLADTDLLIRIEADLCGGPGRAGDEAVFGGGKVIRESMGQSGRTAAERCARPGDHRRRRPRPLGHRQGRRRRARRAHRGARQGRQPRHDGRRPPGPGDRARHRDHRRQRQDPHRRRDRLPRAPHLPADHGHRPRHRHHHDHRRRHRAGRGHQGHHRDRVALVPAPDAHLARHLADQRRPAGQGQHRLDRRHVGAAARRGERVQAARGLGLDPGRDRRLPRRLRRGRACRPRCTPTR